MKNPSLESDKDRWEGERAGGDLVRSAVRTVQQSSAADVIVQDLRLCIHRKLIETLDLSKLSNLEMERVRVEIRHILEDMVKSESIPLSRADRDRLVLEVQHEVFGLGPLETLMKDSEIADILVNTHNQVYVDRYGKLEKTDVRFRDDDHRMKIVQVHIVRLETRPPNIESQGTVTARDLLRNALRMRPDRIVVGEVRGSEALDMMQAMNTGHDGSISTVHANSARDALSRLESMMLMAGITLPERALREQIASALDVIVQLTRLSDGSRKVIEFAEITGMEASTITTQTIFKFEQRDVENGKVVGEFVATGVMPSFMERLERYGFKLPNTHFLPLALGGKRRAL